MARGFESKDVEFQQAEAERGRHPGRAMTPDEVARLDRQRTLELSLSQARAQLAAARSSVHRQMLERAIESLEAQLVNHG